MRLNRFIKIIRWGLLLGVLGIISLPASADEFCGNFFDPFGTSFAPEFCYMPPSFPPTPPIFPPIVPPTSTLPLILPSFPAPTTPMLPTFPTPTGSGISIGIRTSFGCLAVSVGSGSQQAICP